MKALVAVVVLAVSAAVWFAVSAGQVRKIDNTALVDTATTAAVVAKVGEAVQSAFSYDYNDTARTEQAARNVLIDSAVRQYEQLFGKVREQATAQKLVLVTAVRSVGVSELSGDRATALVFLDQQAVRGDNNQHTSVSAQLSVVARNVDGTWKIAELTVL
ncbi:hypothetical protein GCM10010174_41470 [Kutzneria viridogrisea]|uniref:Secreted protein n=2 Tax=Kutzneria TaxID=43356 RepID=W5W8D8_9PSEU|nr:hypothetical protein [Kutzneria albida]AHH96796.1 hypothetical protein KALB_3429 [Kutzneria albida DSM 43870]MBA8927985.1 Mce-associated membrane protein [Kutzneria viridogrisea]